jgi:hypothetical protein
MLADVNFNLSRFWTRIMVLIGAPLLAFLLIWRTLLLALLLGWDPNPSLRRRKA